MNFDSDILLKFALCALCMSPVLLVARSGLPALIYASLEETTILPRRLGRVPSMNGVNWSMESFTRVATTIRSIQSPYSIVLKMRWSFASLGLSSILLPRPECGF